MYNHNLNRIGTFNRCFKLARELAKRKFDMIIVSTNPKICYCTTHIVADRVHIVFLPHLPSHSTVPGRDIVPRIVRIPSFALSALRIKADLVHAFAVANMSTALPAVISRFLESPLVVDWDDRWGGGGLARSHGPIIHALMTLLEDTIPKAADLVTVATSFLANCAMSAGVETSNIAMIPNGCDIDIIHPFSQTHARTKMNIDRDVPVVAYEIGSFQTPQLIGFLFECFAKIHEKRPNAKLLFFGAWLLEKQIINDLAREHRFDHELVVLGRLRSEEMSLALSAADVLLLPLERTIISSRLAREIQRLSLQWETDSGIKSR